MLVFSEARAVTRRLEGELCEVQRVVQGGEESVARLRGQLEEVQEREEATQLQLAHAIAQARARTQLLEMVVCVSPGGQSHVRERCLCQDCE